MTMTSRTHSFCGTLLLGAFLIAALPCSAAEWSAFRGNCMRTGCYGDPVGFPEKQPLWIDSLRCPFVSSPSIAHNTLFIGGRDSSVYALDASRGILRWKAKTHGWVDASPLLHRGMAIVASRDRAIYALDAGNGHVLARFASGLQLSSPALTTDGSTLIAGIGPPKNGFAAYDFSRPKWEYNDTLWFIPFNQITYSSPSIRQSMAVIGVSDGRLCGINLAGRSVSWTVNTGGGVYLSTPAIDDSVVYFAPGNFDTHVYAIDVKSGNILWKSSGNAGGITKKSAASATITPKRFRELLTMSPFDRAKALAYYARNNIHVPILGKRRSGLSKQSAPPDDTVFLYGETKTSSVAVGKNNVYVIRKQLGYPNPLFTLLALEKTTGKEKWRFSEMRSCVKLGYASSPIVTKSMVFFGWGEGKVYGLSAETGERLWEDSLCGDIISSPAIANGKLYVATMKGYIYCYNLSQTMPGENFQKSTYCYPNPSRGNVSNIQVFVTRPGRMDLVIYNSAERPVFRASAQLPAMQPNDDKFVYQWNLTTVANGVYFAKIVVNYNDGGTDKKVLKIAILK